MRDDIKAIPEMKELGFKPEYSMHDTMYNRVVPHDAVSFRTIDGDVEIVWYTPGQNSKGVHNGWTRADLIEGHYRNHTRYDSIESFIQDRKRILALSIPEGLKDYCVPDLKAKLDLISKLTMMKIEAIARGDWKKGEAVQNEIDKHELVIKRNNDFLIEKVQDIERTGRTPYTPFYK